MLIRRANFVTFPLAIIKKIVEKSSQPFCLLHSRGVYKHRHIAKDAVLVAFQSSHSLFCTSKRFTSFTSCCRTFGIEAWSKPNFFYSSQLLKQLSFFHRNLCNHGSYFLAANSSLCGLAANNFFRNILHVRKASLVSALPMAVVPFLSTAAIYEVFVREPLFSGKILIIPSFQKCFSFCRQCNTRELFLAAEQCPWTVVVLKTLSL